jgi:dTDP-4-dehydrorhamnose 3,5-epimerase
MVRGISTTAAANGAVASEMQAGAARGGIMVTPLRLSGLLLIQVPLWRDERGFFMERFHAADFSELGLPVGFIQDNHSRSRPAVLRGLHYQDDPPQGKLVGVTRGRIWDVAVDIRAGSPTFGQSVALELTDTDGRLFWIPAGFAHGFCVLGNEPADVMYKVDAPYNPKGEKGILWRDPDLAIEWPVENPIVSDRDRGLPRFSELGSKTYLIGK